MRGIEQLETEVRECELAHHAAMGRVLAAEARYDSARTSWGREKWRKKVLAAVEEARTAETGYRGAQMDLALLRWDEATRHARELEAIARRAVDLKKGPEAVNKAIEARDEHLIVVHAAAAAVERWKPVGQ